MYRSSRRKRASVQDIYRSCIQGGDCPTDVRNKVEQTTWADTLLKIFSSIIYLGNLGIGTGRGGGGSMGYRPINAQTPRGDTVPVPPRPTIPTVDVIGPQDVLPIASEAPAIIPLEEGIPETGIIDTPSGGPGLDADAIQVTTAIDTVSEVTGVGEHPNIFGESGEAAQIDVQLSPPPPKRIALDPSVTDNISVVEVRHSHIDPNINVFVDAQFDAINIGHPEEIELQEINLREEFEIDQGPLRSTPLSSRAISRARDLYHRFVQQAPTSTADFVGFSSRPNTFEFENPAFDDAIAEEFENDIQQIQTEAGVVRFVGSPKLSETANNTVRISRLAQKPGMTTRSGLQIGQRIHFYYDLSPIQQDAIELLPRGEYSHESTIVDALTTSSFINPFENAINGFPEDMLLDTLEENFTDSQLVVIGGNRDDIEMPHPATAFTLSVPVADINTSYIIEHSTIHPTALNIPSTTIAPIEPGFAFDVNLNTFDIHPSLIRRKRKRSLL
jgi:hypothetical protein